MARYRLTRAADTDIIDILAWSQMQFGVTARERYQKLIVNALIDITNDPARFGSIERPELGDGVRSWHLRGSRSRDGNVSGTVGRPRHFIIYRAMDDEIVIARVLHDAMELDRNTRDPRLWSL